MDKNINPAISVLIPVYNGQQYLSEAISSILNQTYSDFELIIVDDGSADESEKVIKSFDDRRIVYSKNEVNKGLIYSLNKGISISKGEYIARMDQDDISDPRRLEKQINEFKMDSGLVVCGSLIKMFGSGKDEYVGHIPVTQGQIISSVFFACPFAHPSVMMRKEALMKLGVVYREEYLHSEDFDLWSRLVFLGNSKNIPEYLLQYRVHDKQTSTVFEDRKYQSVSKIQTNILSHFGLIPEKTESETLLNLFKGISRNNQEYVYETGKLLDKLHGAFKKKYPQYSDVNAQIIVSRWFKVCGNSGLGIANLKNAFSLPFFKVKYLKFMDLIKLLYKTIINYRQIEKQNG